MKHPTNTITLITTNEIPHYHRKDVTCKKFVCSAQTEKKDKNRKRVTIGGNKID